MTATAQKISKQTIPANEDLLISQLDAAFRANFVINSVASEDGRIKTAQVNTNVPLDLMLVKRLVKIASEWKLKLLISRSGAGLRIHFSRH